MSTPDDFATRMYAAATPQDRGERVPGATATPAAATTSTPSPAAPARPLQPAGAIAKPAAGTLAERMYPKPPTDAKPHASPTHEAPARARESEAAETAALSAGQTSVEDLVGSEPPIEERMLDAAAVVPDTPDGYAVAVDAGFAEIEQAAREAGEEEDRVALLQGRQAAQALLHELRVPTFAAKEVVREVAQWHGRTVPEEQRWLDKDKCAEELERRWGKETHARIALARKVADDASRKLPWFGDMLRNGLGNSPDLIARLSEVALRNARTARRAK